MSTKKPKTVLGKNNPALQFFSEETKAAVDGAPAADKGVTNRDTLPEVPEGYKIIREPKTRRVQLLFQPTLYSRLKAQADAQSVSFNEYIHRLLEKAAKEQEE